MEQENDIILYGISGAGKKRPNIADLLKDCLKGTKLYSPICGECELYKVAPDEVNKYVTAIYVKAGRLFEFYEDGHYIEGGECLLFPSKDVRNWDFFNASYVVFEAHSSKDIKLKELIGHPLAYKAEVEGSLGFFGKATGNFYVVKPEESGYNYILSTGVELKLKEKEQPKFKVGDVVKINGFIHILAEDNTQFPPCKYPDHRYSEYGIGACMNCANDNDTRLATPEEIAKWNKDVLQPNHLHYSKSKRKIIRWFLPFDKIAGRDDEGWYCDLFSHYKVGPNEEYPYCGMGGADYHICLPYNEETARLIGTTDDYKEE